MPAGSAQPCARDHALPHQAHQCGDDDLRPLRCVGEFACRVGLPGKSGVGGGILAIAPRQASICVWSPGLNAQGNSLVGAMALERLASLTGWSVF